MKKRLEAWRAKRPRMGRGRKTALNLLLCALLLVWLWELLGCPMPTAELEYRRLERTNLLRPAHTVCALPRGGQTGEHGSYDLAQPWVVGLGEDRVSAAYVQRTWRQIESFPLEDGPTPVPMSGGILYWMSSGGYSGGFRCPLLFVQVPEEASSAELELDVTYRERDYRRTGQGFRLGDGMWLFAIDSPDTAYAHDWYQGGTYRLTLYRENGSPLLEQSGTIPGAL